MKLPRKYFAQQNILGSAAQFNCSVFPVPPLHPTHNPTPPRGDTSDTLLQVRQHPRYEEKHKIVDLLAGFWNLPCDCLLSDFCLVYADT